MMIAVEVVLVTDKMGSIRPLYVVWKGHLYKIRSIRNVRNAGNKGALYECVIEMRLRHLYHRDNKWYIERY